MDYLRRVSSAILLISIVAGHSFAFDTGSHFDLTRAVLSERGFGDDAVKAVQVENWLTDYFSTAPTILTPKRGDFAKLHFDNLYSSAEVRNYWAWIINNIKNETQNAARKDDAIAALTILGIGLHAIQDFYAHSNWVETHPRFPDGAYRTETYLQTNRSALNESMLFTGKYPDDRRTGPGAETVPENAEVHGNYTSGLNHDSLVRPHWDEAYVFGYVASHELVEAMGKWSEEARPGFWQRVQTWSTDAAGKKKLDYDISALRSMSMWLNGNGADGHWKGNRSGSSRFFGAFSSKWVLSDSSVLVRKMKNSDLSTAIGENLYANIQPPPMPEMSKFSLRRRVVVVRTTLIKESADTSKIQSLINRIAAPDFYSRLTVGSQEFWGRAIQASRESVDPWCEIYFADQEKETIPIVFSVWDEDNPDPAKDAPFDINELSGKGTLDLLFNTSSGQISGDLTGKFSTPETAFTSSGAKPDKSRATIKAYVTQYLLK